MTSPRIAGRLRKKTQNSNDTIGIGYKKIDLPEHAPMRHRNTQFYFPPASLAVIEQGNVRDIAPVHSDVACTQQPRTLTTLGKRAQQMWGLEIFKFNILKYIFFIFLSA
jgi:hypothetical protein